MEPLDLSWNNNQGTLETHCHHQNSQVLMWLESLQLNSQVFSSTHRLRKLSNDGSCHLERQSLSTVWHRAGQWGQSGHFLWVHALLALHSTIFFLLQKSRSSTIMNAVILRWSPNRPFLLVLSSILYFVFRSMFSMSRQCLDKCTVWNLPRQLTSQKSTTSMYCLSTMHTILHYVLLTTPTNLLSSLYI